MSLNLIPWLKINFVKEKSLKTVLEVPMGSHLTNQKWPCYLKIWDSSGENNHGVHF